MPWDRRVRGVRGPRIVIWCGDVPATKNGAIGWAGNDRLAGEEM